MCNVHVIQKTNCINCLQRVSEPLIQLYLPNKDDMYVHVCKEKNSYCVILALLNFIINCELSQLYSHHILVSIIIKSLFKNKCHALARYIIYLIDEHFDLINVENKIFDIGIRHGFWTGENWDKFIVYNISSIDNNNSTHSLVPDEIDVKQIYFDNMNIDSIYKNKFAIVQEHKPTFIVHDTSPNCVDLEAQYELHRQWCQFILDGWFLPCTIKVCGIYGESS